MKANQIRQKFLDFFENKGHQIVPSAPIVVKNDPTLMFNNAGMNQFKDFFLGHKEPSNKRIADTQKCLRVSGKHNDLEEVGIDSYHHTMFEMLGNWSFGDYFKKEAIEWAWELLVDEYKLDEDRLYISVFGGDENEGLGEDHEAAEIWGKLVPEERILYCGKKDNFWEMGDTGPCGPCSEIHIDLRSDEDRKKTPGKELVNEDHPLVIEVWNLVFIQFNRKANGKLEDLPDKHIDTGMGFERLAMAIQGKESNYDTDVFTPFINIIEKDSGIKYTGSYELSAKTDIAMRVISDHVRAVSFAIADGELPSNTGAGYVIRRILRRGIRYYYSFLNIKEPFIYKLVNPLSDFFKEVFPELEAQKSFVAKVIEEEEKSFLRTLAGGLKRLQNVEVKENRMDGNLAFELYDTYGFPIDLTRLLAAEKGWTIDEKAFATALQEQKERGRADAKRETGDWMEVVQNNDVEFIGYDYLSVNNAKITKHRTIKEKGKDIFQVVLDKTPFYAEGGGQVGDTGVLKIGNEVIQVIDTKKENDLIIHFVNQLPQNFTASVDADVNVERRSLIENNHSATHLIHAALRTVLGTHVQQKGSLVRGDQLRFDFSHFQKMTGEELSKVEQIVNQKIRQNIALQEHRSIPIQEAQDAGAIMLFGEKYGDHVRMITFDPDYSRELCGGCHVSHTGQIGLLKITSESGIAAGVRRIEAITADAAEEFVNIRLNELNEIKSMSKSKESAAKSVASLQDENKALKKELEKMMASKAGDLKGDLIKAAKDIDGVKVIASKVQLDNNAAKTLAHNLGKELESAVVLLGLESEGKAQLMLLITKDLTESKSWNAGNMIRDLSKEINGGGGGQAFFATAGGANPAGLEAALNKLESLLV